MKTTLTVLALALAATLAWALGRAPGEQAALAPPSPVVAAVVEGTPSEVDLVAQVREAGAEAPARRREISAGVTEDSAGQASDARLEPATAGSLEVLVVAKETGAALPGVRISVAEDGGDGRVKVDWVDANERKGPPITDEEGRARFLLSPDTPIRVWASVRANGASAVRRLEPFTRGETRTVRLELPTQPDAHFVGRVVDAVSGEPISGALVRFPSSTSAFLSDGTPTTSKSTGEELRTGPQGWFEAPVATWSRRYGRVDAEGFGPRVFQLDRGHESRERALVVRLQRGATLRGLILGAPDLVDLSVRVEAKGYELKESSGPVFFSFGDMRRQAPVAQNGTWVMTDLPPGARLVVELWQGRERLRSEPEQLRLGPGEERSLEWRLGGGATLRGRAVIADTGEPLAGSPIWLVRASEARRLLASYMKPIARTETDDEGHFTFADLPSGEWCVGPAPVRADWEPPQDDDVAPVSTRVVIPEGGGTVEVELRVYRGLFIQGEILGLDGERAKNSHAFGYSTASGVWSNRRSSDGTFRLGPLVPGSYELTARGGGENAAQSEPVTAMAGDENVVLRLSAGGSIRGRLVAAATGEGVRGPIRVAPEENPSLGWTMTQTQLDGSFSFSGLSPGSYTVSGTAGDLVGRVEGVVIGPLQSVRDLEVSLEPGAVLLVTYTGERLSASYRVKSGGTETHMDGLEIGRPSRSVHPPGQVVVTVNYRSLDGESHTVERTVDLVVGEETKVEVGDE